MKRQLFFLMLTMGLFATAQSTAQAQSPVIGRGGVQYNGYGRGYYGGYGQGYGGGYGPRIQTYSGYGNGPYGYGSGDAYQYPVNDGYSYSNGTYYNGYGNPGYYVQPYAPAYRPYGFGVYIQ